MLVSVFVSAVKLPNSGLNDLLLGEEFMENCVEMFSVPYRGSDTNQKAFQTKHLNIIDPLKENNNLGRSVHRGNENFNLLLFCVDDFQAQ